MIVFHSDLDNTLIYSYKHNIGENKVCVEVYQGREISFMTENSYNLLKDVNEKVLFVPTTTRTMEQYNRIDLGIGVPKFALVCNGGVLLVDGQEDEEWYKESLELVAECNRELEKAEQLLEKDEYRSFEVRNIKSLFIFTKSEEPQKTIKKLVDELDLSLVDVFANGVKVYVVPKRLSKGMAISRFQNKIQRDKTVAAGDSEFDISMLQKADVSIAPKILLAQDDTLEKCISFDENIVFSDALLTHVINISK